MTIIEPKIDEIIFNQNTVELIIAHLKECCQIDFNYYKREFLERRIKARMYRLNMISDLDYLNYLSKNKDEFREFTSLFTINYTYFFRNYDIYRKLQKNFLEKKIRTQNSNKLRIWSAPCSTGEEPYSIAILFDYLKQIKINMPEVEIIASDIDSRSINIAKSGVYGTYSVHDLPVLYKNYFKEEEDFFCSKFILNDEIKNKVKFIKEDLTVGHQLNQKYDIIFCRNFLIYLNRDTQQKVLKTLHQHLIPGGILVVGKTEMILPSKSKKFAQTDAKHHFYRPI